MSRKMLLAALGFALFTALPLLTPSDEVKAQPLPQVTRNPDVPGAIVCALHELAKEHMAGIAVMNRFPDPGFVDVRYVARSGTAAITTTARLDGPGSGYYMPPDGFKGSVHISSTSGQPLAAIVNVYASSTSEAPAASYRCLPAWESWGLIFPIESNKQDIRFQNTDDDPTVVTMYLFDATGGQSQSSPYIRRAKPYQSWATNANKVGDRNVEWPGYALAYGDANNVLNGYTTLDSRSVSGPRDVLPAVDWLNSADQGFLPLPGPRVVGAFTATLTIVNHESGDQPIDVVFLDPDGHTTTAITGTLPSRGIYQRSAVFTPLDPPDLVIVGVDVRAASTYVQYDGLPERGRSTTSRSGAWPASKPTDVITKRGYGFGAPSTKKSKVSVVLHNVGAKTVKVKLRIFDGDTGKKVQSGTATIAAGGSATVPFKKRARGGNLFAEISVKGKGSVLGWLMRTHKGDADFYTAVPR